jgi:cyclopropane fatty-acyl-phospholipid synthase-like methyltransferase
MPQITQGIRSLLSIPDIYSLFGLLIGGSSCRTTFVREYVRPNRGDRILDIGCGPGDILPYLPDVKYTGFDASQEYIRAAKERFGEQATFICEQVSTTTVKERSSFDIVLAVGIIHHLDDAEALQLFHLAKVVLKPGGRLITFDGVFVPDQSPCARYIISKDRGQNVRTKEGYLAIASQIFSNISVSIRHDLLRIPYTHIVIECSR